MRRLTHRRTLVPSLTLLFIAAGHVSAAPTAERPPAVVTLGMIAEMPGETVERHIDFVRYVARRLSASGETRGAVRIAPTPDALVKLIDEGRVHFYMESLYSTYVVNERTGARLLLRRWKKGRGEYRSVIFARKDSDLGDLDDLRGKLVVFEDPGSTSGYFLPRSLLLRKGFALREKSSFGAEVAAAEIGYVFAHGDEENVVNWVLLGRAAAGALSDADIESLDARRRADLVVLAETEAVPRHLVSVSPALAPDVAQRLKAVLLSMHEHEEGRAILERTDGTTRFDELPSGAEVVYQRMRFLQEREFERVGGTKPMTVDVRVIAATNRDLEAEVRARRFREDLYYRLNVVPITLPPLRARRDDVPALARFFLERFAREAKTPVPDIAPEAVERLVAYDWPGNVRELANLMERAVVLGEGATITTAALPERLLAPQSPQSGDGLPYHEAIDAHRRQLIVRALEQAGGNRAAAARALGLQRTYLSRLIRNLGIR